MNPQEIYCPIESCPAKRQFGKGNINIQDQKKIMVKLPAKGCPRQAIVFAFGLDERTVADWECPYGEPA